MTKDIKNLIQKTAKFACVTCVALGGVALIASGAVLKGMKERAKDLKDTSRKILEKEPEEENIGGEAAVVEAAVSEENSEVQEDASK